MYEIRAARKQREMRLEHNTQAANLFEGRQLQGNIIPKNNNFKYAKCKMEIYSMNDNFKGIKFQKYTLSKYQTYTN